MIFGSNLAIYTVFYKESESEVKKCKNWEPGGKKSETPKIISNYYLLLFFIWLFNLNLGLFLRGDVFLPSTVPHARKEIDGRTPW